MVEPLGPQPMEFANAAISYPPFGVRFPVLEPQSDALAAQFQVM